MDITNFSSTSVNRNTDQESESHCAKYCADNKEIPALRILQY